MIRKQLSALRLPDFITLLGLAASIFAVFTLWRSENVLLAYFGILGQIVADFLDGRIARRMKLENTLGVHLDNFADFFTIFATLVLGWRMGIEHVLASWIFGFFLIAAAIRLAYFTVENAGKLRYFSGVPTTAVSFSVSTLLILNFFYGFAPINVFLGIYLLAGILMISSLRIPKL